MSLKFRKYAGVVFSIFLLSLFLPAGMTVKTVQAAEAEGAQELEITGQPESVQVNYPDGAEFHVEVNDPELVESWQWKLKDVAGNVFVLEGNSAKTDTLVIPCTSQYANPEELVCTITDINGNVIETEPAVIEVMNKEEDKTVLYVGDYAIEPGEELDLSETPMEAASSVLTVTE